MARRGPRFAPRRRSAWRGPLWVALLLLAGFLLAGWLRPQWFLAAEFARQRWLAGASEKQIELDGRRWNYLDAGSGPPLLLLHGFTGSKENWLPVIGELSRVYRVIAPDLPGWGYIEPDVPQPPYGYRADAERLNLFVDTLLGPQRIHLVGHSMGGGIAAVFAAEWPQRVERLALVSAAGVEFDNAFARAVLRGEHPFAVDDRADLQRYLGLVFEAPPWVPWPVDRAIVQQRRINEPFEREVLAAISLGAESAAPMRAAPAIRAPTLLLWCRDDRVVDVAAAERYAELIPHATVELLDDCNHMPMMERPAATATIVRRFLATR